MKKTILYLSSLLIMSCAVKKNSGNTETTPPNAPVVTTPKAQNSGGTPDSKTLQNAAYDFNTLSISSDASISINGTEHSVNIIFRFENEKKIWASAQIFGGIEAGRALITPDSIRVINTFGSQYIAKPFSYIAQYVGKNIDFNTLQALLIGNIPAQIWKQNPKLSNTSAGETSVNASMDNTEFSAVLNSNSKPQSIQYEQLGNILQLLYSNFTTVNKTIPQVVKLKANVNQKVFELNLNYESIQRNIPLEFPFNVPKRYSLTN